MQLQMTTALQVFLRSPDDTVHRLTKALEYVKNKWQYYSNARKGSHVVMHTGRVNVSEVCLSHTYGEGC